MQFWPPPLPILTPPDKINSLMTTHSQSILSKQQRRHIGVVLISILQYYTSTFGVHNTAIDFIAVILETRIQKNYSASFS